MNYEKYLTEPQAETVPTKRKRSNLWQQLSTMRFAVWTLIVLGVLSLFALFAGELQDPEALKRPPATAGEGMWRAFMTLFQMHDPFRAWWYRLLLGVLCLSLFACLLERAPVIWRLWTKKPPQDTAWLRAIRHGIVRTTTVPREKLAAALHHFRWRWQGEDLWVGERGRIGMWGPLCTHCGLLLLGIGALVSSFGGVHERGGGFAGDVVQVKDMPFVVRIDSFRIEYYPLQPGQWVQVDGEWVGRLESRQPDGTWLVRDVHHGSGEGEIVPVSAERIRNRFNPNLDRSNIKRFASFVTVFENDRELFRREIAVNEPLRYRGFRLYQSSYDPDRPRTVAEYDSLTVILTDTATGERKELTLKPGVEAPVPGDTLRIVAGALLPHFKLGQQGAYSESPEFINPAVRLTFRGLHGFEKGQWSFLRFPSHDSGPGRWNYRLGSLFGERASQEIMTIFEIRKTHGASFLWAGFLIGTLGLVLSFYVNHRVLYIEWAQGERKETQLTGLTRKMQHLFARQLDRILESLSPATSTPEAPFRT